MGYKKELSTNCSQCKVEWENDYSNKHPKRALCIDCYKKEASEYRNKYKKEGKGKKVYRSLEHYQPFKLSNRIGIWREVAKRGKALKTIEEIKEFTKKRFDEILEDIELWNYINNTNIPDGKSTE